MSVKALGSYDFPAKDRQELFGDDQLVHVLWENNMFFCAAACFRVPRAMTWSDFKTQMIDPWASADPDYRPNDATGWRIDEEEINPKPTETIADLGIPHKGVIRFRVPQ
ncbi:MAG: phenol hydroxylase subunit P4 [Mycobacterium sp.]|uniref:phenol hydroxylase subunit P4 n=1 Tax=Mycobacterium sp. TaxID=1785 RepID=UPI00261C18FB|nr:phenol hydroxylase subunit P4 [Mycobacterium sp.]MDI3313828.1 phenol hydroxylase subunit P4 [Mycobacterium sp.]